MSMSPPLTRLEELAKLKDELTVLIEKVLRREEGIAEGRVRIWVSDVVIKVSEVDKLICYVVENMPCPPNRYANKVSKIMSELIALKHRAPLPRDFTTQGFENEKEELFKCLIEDKVNLMGIWGMGGLGKTTLLTQLYDESFSHFEFVVWLQVSEEVKVEELRVEIAKQIVSQWKAKNFNISQLLHGKKILVLLDDLWNRVELRDIGISMNICQVVFTTRSKAVCTLMEAKRTFKLKLLSSESSWQLFQDRIGIETHPDIETIARGLVRECVGLPLALVSCALSLSSSSCKHSVKNSAFRHVFLVLKSSYDRLPHPYMKSCLSYCALFPEYSDIPKEKLIDKWICEDFLDNGDDDNKSDPFTKGYRILEALVDLSLLEDAFEEVKMHRLIRDMCLWIASEVEGEKRNYFVQSVDRFGKAPCIGRWKDAKIMSLMCNDGPSIRRIVKSRAPPPRPHLSTLLFSGNPKLGAITLVCGFIWYTKSLTVLELSHTGIKVFPDEILELVSLQYLDISHTEIERLPRELMKLERLKCFNLEFTCNLLFFPIRLLGMLKHLQVFRMFGSRRTLLLCSVEDLERSECLKALSLTIKDADIYHYVLGSRKLSKCIQSLILEDIGPPNGEFLGTTTGSSYRISETTCFHSLRRVKISCCHYLQDLTWLIRAPNLTKLVVRYCENLKEISTKIGDPFAKIRELELIGLPNLKSICREPKLFPNLKVMRVCGCPMLKKLPLNANSAKGCDLAIEGTPDWWNELRWEDEATRSVFKSSYDDIVWSGRRDGKCTQEDKIRYVYHRVGFCPLRR